MLIKLRVKFVCIMMSMVTIMLCVIFGLIIWFTGTALENQSIQMMQSIADDPFQLGRPFDFSNEVKLPYFIVQVNRQGDILATSGGFYDLSDEATIRSIIQAALSSKEQTGILEEYGLRFSKSNGPAGQSIVFADISSERATMSNLVRGCVAIGVLSLAIFWVISMLLARWAVKPVDEAWQQQKQFVADASHELKTPLTVIMTNAEMLQDPEYDDSSRQQFSASILTMSQQMRGLVEGLLELARVDNGAVKTSFTEVDMSGLVEEGAMIFEPLYFEKELILSTAVEKGVRLKGSASHLHQVLDILLDNAMKYASPHGEVRVKLKKQGGHCTLSVASPGAAISQSDLKNIFKRFYRLDKARSRNGSYGLGLSIAQSIVEEHGGRIWAESVNGINTFFVQLPVM